MEHVSGVPLKGMWSRMTEVQHFDLNASMEKLMKELCALEFESFGSLYFNTADKPPGTHPINEKYYIGLHCGRHFWGYNDNMATQAAGPTGFQGPCKLRAIVIPCSHQLTPRRAGLIDLSLRSHSHQQSGCRPARILLRSRWRIFAAFGNRRKDIGRGQKHHSRQRCQQTSTVPPRFTRTQHLRRSERSNEDLEYHRLAVRRNRACFYPRQRNAGLCRRASARQNTRRRTFSLVAGGTKTCATMQRGLGRRGLHLSEIGQSHNAGLRSLLLSRRRQLRML
jgi:hypothetical protein